MGKRAPSQLAAPAKRPATDMFSAAAKQKRAWGPVTASPRTRS
eukprot:CAMPEP_0182905606 /NCGR_PEP_ID=MMETSP0034_2-20130328/33075_1 /TAXON_ID=156128 /ORGANISM="Nephroselmis pyriformis, Strain CCMP717" /LENGTH=42 /DNA_ID= /DNA_START= /DNA_END= /DNA_ORIENTATION=